MKDNRQVLFGSTVIEYRVERSSRRGTVTIGVGPTGEVILKAPAATPAARLDQVVKQKGAWILQHRMEFSELGPLPSPKEFVVGESYSYLGRTYRLRLDRARAAGQPTALLQGAYLNVIGARRTDPDERAAIVRRAVVAWYHRQAGRRLPERVALYARRAGVDCPPVLVRDQEKRWGSCSIQGELRFNWRIMMAPMSLVDYVVAHEICHLQVRDHSSRFWKLLGTLLPDHQQRRDRLRIDGLRFQL